MTWVTFDAELLIIKFILVSTSLSSLPNDINNFGVIINLCITFTDTLFPLNPKKSKGKDDLVFVQISDLVTDH